MAGPEGAAGVGFPAECGEEGEGGGGVENEGFGEAFGVFVFGVGIPDDAAADGVGGALVGFLEVERADGDVEARVAVGTGDADGAGVDAAGRGFKGADDFGRLDFGCAGDGCAGEECAKELGECGGGLRLDGGGHLPDGGEALNLEEVGGVDGAGFGDAAQVVSHHVHDHDVFGAVFGGALELGGASLIFIEPAAARGGSFHGATGDLVAGLEEEEFGRCGADGEVWGFDEGGVLAALGATERGEAGEWGGGVAAVEGEGVVDLIGLAAGDGGFDLFDVGAVGRFVELRGEVEGWGVAAGFCCGLPGVEEREPGEWESVGGGGVRGEGGVEGGRGFIGEEADGPLAARVGRFDVLEEREHFIEGVRGENCGGVLESQPGGLVPRGLALDEYGWQIHFSRRLCHSAAIIPRVGSAAIRNFQSLEVSV